MFRRSRTPTPQNLASRVLYLGQTRSITPRKRGKGQTRSITPRKRSMGQTRSITPRKRGTEYIITGSIF